MKYSSDALAIAEQFEGCKLTAYPDPGTGGAPWTIGYGHTRGVRKGDTCTMEQALHWLQDDMKAAETCVNMAVTTKLTQDEFDALCDFVFNLGPTNFRKSTLLKKLNVGDIQGASNEFEKWDLAAGKVMQGLLNRRLAEKELFLKEDDDAAVA